MPEPTPPARYVPGDYFVREIHDGFLIGRIVQREGPGPLWEPIVIIPERPTAVDLVVEMARAVGMRAWLIKDTEQEMLGGPES